MGDSLSQIQKEIDKFVDGVIIKLSLDIVANLKRGNPVDTGWSRANWLPNIDRRFKLTEPVGSKTTVATARTAQEASTAGLLAYTRSKGSIVIYNNVPYIVLLNERHPAAQGFVQASIMKAISDLSK